jgi:hypothetical protein
MENNRTCQPSFPPRIFKLCSLMSSPCFIPFFFIPFFPKKHFHKITREHSLFLHIFFILISVYCIVTALFQKQTKLVVRAGASIWEKPSLCVYCYKEEKGERQKITGGGGRGGPTGDILTVSCYRSASPGGGGERCALLEIADVFTQNATEV